MDARVRILNDQPIRRSGRYVLYWCRWNRRVESNHALLYAAETANQMNLPLVCYERLSCAYPTASDRFHTFVLQGVPEMQADVHQLGAGYIFQLPRRKSTSDAARREVIAGAAAVVTAVFPILVPKRIPQLLLPDKGAARVCDAPAKI